MTGSEALDLHLTVQELLRQQRAALASDDIELAEGLGLEVSRFLDQLPDHLDGVDEAMRQRLLEMARDTTRELHSGMVALEQLRQQHIEQNARAERDGAALRRYLPNTGAEPAHFLDERR